MRKSLADYCQYLKGVGPVRAERLRKLGIETVEDLITHFPRRYFDRRNLNKITSLELGGEANFVGQILSVAQRGGRRRRSIVTAAVGDDTGIIQVIWFNQPYLAKVLKPGTELVASGELSYFNGARQVVNPEFEIVGDSLDQELIHTGRIVPVYPLTNGVSQRFLRELIARTLDEYADTIVENLPPAVLDAHPMCGRIDAIRSIHYPEDKAAYERALWRIKFEELFYMQLVFALQRQQRRSAPARPQFDIDFALGRRFVDGLPYRLTHAQSRVLEDIRTDLSDTGGMHRLLQGDVGSGKTVVAGTAMLAAVEAGWQAALMVPTEILAVQHAKTLSELFAGIGVDVGLLIGSLGAREKARVRAQIADGSLPVVAGTHALIQEEVTFARLGLVVIDEQHRFGVRQRAALLGQNPHVLVMTATPIPRTLALTAYADLDLSVLDEMPPGRAEVKTRTVTPSKREAMYEFIGREIQRGARAYLLYPVIDETEKQDLEAAVSAYEELSRGVFRDTPIGLLHGRMSFAEKEAVMGRFASGQTKLLVTTTVVEVGVHVPEATIMVVHHPERFGLSQLHQLRGRVGRGGKEGYCFLLMSEGLSPSSRERLAIMTRVSDGFKIAEEDLRIRGPGEFFGVRQHGVPGLKVANPAVDGKIVEASGRAVKRLMGRDPYLEKPEQTPCRRYLETRNLDLAGHTIG